MTTRLRLSLDGRWQFWTDPDASLSPSSPIPSASSGQAPHHSSLIPVPAPWQSQPEFRFYTGVGWYQRTFEIAAEWLNGRSLILGFGAADYRADVWLNGVKVGEHEGGYLPFEFDVVQAAHPGVNTLTVRVDDPLALFPEVPHGKQSWYGHLSGLWQSVWLESRSTTHLVRVRVTPRKEQVDVLATLNQPLAADQGLRYELFSPDGRLCVTVHSQETAVSLPVPSPQLWDINTPNLYTLQVTLHQQLAPLDSLAESFGFRTIESKNGQLYLNGRPFYLRGALDQDYYPELICTTPSTEYLEDQFRKAKTMGLNCLRLHIKIADPRYYQAADRLGLLIWTELPNWQLLTPLAQQVASDTLLGMVQRDWNHPSIIIWTIVNESWGVDLTNPEHRAWLVEMYDTLKQFDPYRLVVGNSACEGNFQIVTDILDFHNYYAIPDHYDQWRDWVKNLAGGPSWILAHEYENYKAWRTFMRQPWKRRERLRAAEVRVRGDEPLLVSEFGNWGLPDVTALRREYGGEPWWFETGLEWSEGVVYPHGIEERFYQFHLNQVFPTLSDLTAASQRLQFAALKYEIEQVRRHQSLVGYIITEFTDVHWESNGLLDMCRQPKLFFADLGRLNADDLLIPHWRRLVFWEGEVCEVELLLSHYSTADLQDSRLSWHVDGFPEVTGELIGPTPSFASVTRLGEVSFTVPFVSQGSRTRLVCQLVDGKGQPIAHTEQELTFFPRQAAQAGAIKVFAPTLARILQELGYTLADSLETADIALVETITDEMRLYLLQGGRVLWLADAANSLQTHLGSIRVKQRKGSSWQGDWASSFSWIRQDGLFDNIPTQGVVDFVFADLTPGYVIQGFQPHEFATHVYAGLFVGWLHKTVALIAERRIGRGQLLISTFRLVKQLKRHPVAAIMLRDMLTHLT